MSRIGFSGVVIAYLVLVLLFGGASAAGFVPNAVLQVLGALLLGWCLAAPDPLAAPWPSGLRRCAIALLVLIAVQFIPLPPFVWSALPGRGIITDGYAALNQPAPWQMLSLSPWNTVAALAWWIPALALAVALTRSTAPSSAALARTVASVAVVSIAFGAMQRAGGQFYFYQITNYGLGTGFFANANHQASFLLCALALWAAGFSSQRGAGVRRDRLKIGPALYLAVLGLLILGIILSNSLAGIGLLVLILIATVVTTPADLQPSRPLVWLGLALVTAAVFAMVWWGTAGADLGQKAIDPGQTRLDFNRNGLALLRDIAPFGTGLGTFQEVYHWTESPNAVTNVYVNHAHNDLLELLIETGVFGLIALSLFLLWWARRAWDLWQAGRANSFALGGAIMTAAILAHSLVDYPLRTAAISSLFAMGCVLMIRSEPDSRRSGARGNAGASKDFVSI